MGSHRTVNFLVIFFLTHLYLYSLNTISSGDEMERFHKNQACFW